MKNILIIGAGKSSATLIKYLIENAEKEQWIITIVDRDMDTIVDKTAKNKQTVALEADIRDEEIRRKLISESDVVVSMLPARFHMPLIVDCVALKTDIVTPSYENTEVRALNDEAVKNDVLIMNEIGLDPGIDHMSAKRIIDNINDKGGELTYFESFTGGLVAPESDDNPWNYKFTWNPRNVVLAGQGSAAKFIQKNRYKYIPYNRLFRRTEVIDI
jgi:saccharopine dehydrogenase (NAD+, L-glutamate forming)